PSTISTPPPPRQPGRTSRHEPRRRARASAAPRLERGGTSRHEGDAMRGHVAKKGNRYYAVIYEGIEPKTGRQRHRWYAGGSTRKEAEKLLAEMVKRSHDGDYRVPERITLGQYLEERWL